MTEVLSLDRSDGLVGNKSSAKFSLLMQGSSCEKERTGAKTDIQEQKRSLDREHHYHHLRSNDQSQDRNNNNFKSSPNASVGFSKTADSRGMNKAEEMTTMRDRYRYHDEEGSSTSKTNVLSAENKGAVSSSPSTSSLREDLRSSPQHGGNGGSSGLKRRHSQRSPSRPRSQQGSQAAQIATIREVEKENDNQRMMDKGAEEEGAVSDDEGPFRHGVSVDSPRKVARLDQRNPVSYGHMSESVPPSWSKRPNPTQQSESESTSATSSRAHMSNSHNSSVDDDPRNMRKRADLAVEGNMDEQDQGGNYTWQHHENSGSLPTRSGGGGGQPMNSRSGNDRSGNEQGNRFSHLPTLVTGFQTPNAPSSAPVSATNAEGGEPLSRVYERSSSPAPRLPSFAALSPYQPQTRGRLPSPTPSNPSGNPSGLSNVSHHHHPQQQQQHQHHQRRDEYGYSSHGITSPRAPGPSSMSANSPSLSHSSHQTPGQAFIHPSLAGLPGTGGDAGSKQQPSFVSKLYSMLEDDSIADMIAWGPSGTTFSVANPGEFAKVVLPNWFKHSNWQSFVRQLNMYGFHKVNHTYQGTPEAEIQVWEFKHPSFRRGEIHLLGEIKRKSSRHKRQDSMTRSMTNAADYEMMGTPSPEMGMMSHGHMGGMMQGSHSMAPYGSQAQVVRSHHPGQGSIHHPYARQQSGPSSGAPGAYHEYPDPSGVPVSGGEQVGVPSSIHYSHHREERPAPPPQSRLPHPESNVAGQIERGGNPIVAGESVNVRMDDLSDRIDAIIRHATYLEGQLRTVSDQMFHAQQNEASLRAHVHYLESQMRSLSDQMYQQRQSSGGGPMPSRAFSPQPQEQGQLTSSGSGSGSGNAPIAPTSPSSSFSGRMRQFHPGSPSSMRDSGGRYQSAIQASSNLSGQSAQQSQQQQQQLQQQQHQQQSQQGMPSYVTRSPSMGHPSFSNRGMGHGGGAPINAPPPSSGSSARLGPASSADAYAKLRPPPVPSNVQRTKRDSPP